MSNNRKDLDMARILVIDPVVAESQVQELFTAANKFLDTLQVDLG